MCFGEEQQVQGLHDEGFGPLEHKKAHRTNKSSNKGENRNSLRIYRFHQATIPQRKIMRIDTTELASDFRRGWRKRLEKRRWCHRVFDGNGSLRLILWQTLVMVHCRGIRTFSVRVLYLSFIPQAPQLYSSSPFAPRLKVTCGWLCHIAYLK